MIIKWYKQYTSDYDHFVCNNCGYWGKGTPTRCSNCGSSFISWY